MEPFITDFPVVRCRAVACYKPASKIVWESPEKRDGDYCPGHANARRFELMREDRKRAERLAAHLG